MILAQIKNLEVSETVDSIRQNDKVVALYAQTPEIS